MRNWDSKVRCIESKDNTYLTKGKIYEVINGRIINNTGTSNTFQDIHELNRCMEYAKFEEVFDKPDKIKLLLKYGFEIEHNNIHYKVFIIEDCICIDINYVDCTKNRRFTQHEIRWGKRFNTTLADVQSLLDALNIEIVEESPKYKIDIEGEYSEEELEVLKKAGIKFKKVGE